MLWDIGDPHELLLITPVIAHNRERKGPMKTKLRYETEEIYNNDITKSLFFVNCFTSSSAHLFLRPFMK